MARREGSQSQCLSADRVEIGQGDELIVLEVLSSVQRASLENFSAQLLLDVGVQTEKVQDACERVRGGVRAGEGEGPVCAVSVVDLRRIEGGVYVICAMISFSGSLSAASTLIFSRTSQAESKHA